MHFHPRYAHQVRNYLEYDRFSNPQNLVIFHFSIGSPVMKKFLHLPDKKIIIYHNITPYHFFLDFHRILAKDCYKGRLELLSLADKVDLALGDSEYNRQELLAAGFKKTGVLPLVMDFSKFDAQPLPVLQELFADGKTNLLYVGRIIPNKKIEDIIKTFYFYQKYFQADSRLFIIGEYRGFERYFAALQKLIRELQVKSIHFSGHIPLVEVVSYFKLSHLYLHLSEHEGFCAPVLESFHLRIPVVAFAAGAVRETMSGGGMLINEKNFLQIAALGHEILTNQVLKNKILAGQDKALKKHSQKKSGKILLDYLRQLQP
jgi:glycosyltransferase involved in cell wall biosynthesis